MDLGYEIKKDGDEKQGEIISLTIFILRGAFIVYNG
jgi:hypothetical protein